MHIFRRKPRAEKRPRPWAVTAAALLLLLESTGLIALTVHDYPAPESIDFQVNSIGGFFDLMNVILSPLTYGWLGLLGLLAFIGLLQMRSRAWTTAMFVQGGVLLSALILYLRSNPPFTYPMMLFGIFMVFYLHYNDVQSEFRSGRQVENGNGPQ
ncbi:MAG: hypothetical protein DWQ07_16780 [Chloroflexi bacterium]|nr:MAG: hypothetical protein DWQ07_16780 [Chloroflexota bacterium]MBL1195403.1 hypothetical protein [Chloroflexota bacterium]NOH12686.1 hypothetical protein [Chloroflexota bacterium]